MHALFALSPIPEAVYLLVYPISSTLMPEVAKPGSCPSFLHVKLESLA